MATLLRRIISSIKKNENVNTIIVTLVKNRKKAVLILLLAVVSIISLTRYSCTTTDTEETDLLDIGTDKNLTENTGIEFLTVEKKDIADEIEVMGQILFYEKINLSSKVTGRLQKLYVREGSKVARRQLIAEVERLPLQIQLRQQLAELDIARKTFELTKSKYENALKAIEIKLKTIEKAKADLEDKKVSYQNMDRILKNKRILFKAGGVSESDLESLKAQHKTSYTKYMLAESDLEIQKVGYRDEDIIAEGYSVPKSEKARMELIKKINTKIERAELEASRSKIHQTMQSIESTKILIQETYIRSPINGVVASKNMEAGEMIKEDSVIATLMNIDRVFIAMNVNEKEIKKIKSGQTVIFTVDAIGNENFKGSIDRITPVLDQKTRTIEIKAVMDNPGKRLLPGMFARAHIQCGTLENKIAVPLSSLIKREEDAGLLYIVKKGITFKQKVKLGAVFKNSIEIVEGIQPGDVIIAAGVNLVYPGMKIEEKIKK
jgi:RND family efflux transporter MFP subunit